MTVFIRLFSLGLLVLLLGACSGTQLSGSWSDPEFQGQLEKVYIIGIAEKETNRRIFEETFSSKLASSGVTGIPSYKDLPRTSGDDEGLVKQKMIENGADSVILTQLIGQRTESVTSPGRVSGYSSGPHYSGQGSEGSRPNYYRNWNSYYDRRHDISYDPPATTQYVILTVESVLYDLETEEMIWSAQLETVLEGKLGKMMQGFVDAVVKDLQSQGLI